MVPASMLHQVGNIANTMKVAVDFVSPFNAPEMTKNVERIYREVLEGALELPDTLAKETAFMLARTAGLRLSNLYRETGQDGEAELLAKELKAQIKRLEETS